MSVQTALFQKSYVLVDQGRYKDAIALIKQSLNEDPQNEEALGMLAACQYALLDNKSALQSIEQALRLNPENPFFHRLKALIVAQKGEVKKARKCIEDALKLDSGSSDVYANQSFIYIHSGDWLKAEAAARKALSLDAEHLEAMNLLGLALQMQGKLDDSQDLLQRLLSLDPESASAHSIYGWWHLRKNNLNNSFEHFKEALRIDPNFEPSRMGLLETYKAKSPAYRIYLQYSFYTAKLNIKTRSVLSFLILLLGRMVTQASSKLPGNWMYIGLSFVILLYGAMVWMWMAEGVGKLFLALNPDTRILLKKTEAQQGSYITIPLIAIALSIVLAIFKIYEALGMVIFAVMSWVPFATASSTSRDDVRILCIVTGYIMLTLGVIFSFSFRIKGWADLGGYSLLAAFLIMPLGTVFRGHKQVS